MADIGSIAMAINDDLLEFVRNALARGTPRTHVQEILLGAGWSRDQVSGALDSYADVAFPIPVPRPRPHLSAREAFVYLLLFSTLYVTAYNLGAIAFYYIERVFPDPAEIAYADYTRQAIRWALSSVIVASPVFLYVSWVVERSVRRDPAKRRSNVRRWLMYLTIFVAAGVLIGDFTTLVYNALGGELTIRFVFKVFVVAAIAGTVFGYYLSDLRFEETKSVADDREWKGGIAAAAVVAIVAATFGGLVMIGSPSEERLRRLDARRIRDLQEIEQAVSVYHGRHQRLPISLAELSSEAGMIFATRDPASLAYEYKSLGARDYEVCANFERQSSRSRQHGAAPFWSHGQGRQCFQMTAKQNAMME
jgi:hypothetical protein